MGTQSALMTVEEMRRLPEPKDGSHYELHHGELVQVTYPKYNHGQCIEFTAAALRKRLRKIGRIRTELGFRTLPEYEAWRADISFLTMERHDQALQDNDVFGAPDLVVEVLSPSNTATEMDEKEAHFLSHGCREFWLINRSGKLFS